MLDSYGHGEPSYVVDLLSLDADGVHQLFAEIGFPQYQEQLNEHGITGDVLVHLDHPALKDVGVHSVGQRLAILKTVYELKVAQNIPIEEGHYVPPSEEMDADTLLHTQQVLGMLSERDDRIRNLEHEVHNLHNALFNLRDEALSMARSAPQAGKTRQNIRSPTSSTFPHPLSNASTLSRSTSSPSRPRHPPPVAVNSNLAIPSSSGLPDSPNSPVVDSSSHAGDYQRQQQALHPQDGSGHGHPTEVSINGVPTPTTPTVQMLVPPDSAAAANGAPVSLSATSSSTTLVPPSSARSTVSTPDSASQATLARSPSTSRSKDGSSGGGGSGNNPDNPYRSFRVTLEDPCYKVLPAALKKYKINDDWRLYALFICYGNTERCLAYDEKPLILFQKLKESNDNPVFMLRHIKDIKSPIAVASAKHAARRDKRPPGIGGGVERSLMGVNRDGSAAPSAPTLTPANGLGPNARPTRLHHPPVLLPVGKDKAAEEAGDGSNADRKDEKERRNQGYCIAIYPYLAEREDEFDVAVGDTFVILSKTKGWWVVHRDHPSSLSSPTSSNPDYSLAPRKSAWVPAGCLLETSVPPLSLLTNSSDPAPNPSTTKSSQGVSAHEGNAASVPIPPSYVVSVSTPGVALMDYAPRGPGELEVKKGQPLRILKRYNHWSYAIKEDGGRGWLPSWFCGRASKSDGANAGAGAGGGTGTPTTPTVPTSGAGSSVTVVGQGDGSARPSTAPSGSVKPTALSVAVPPVSAGVSATKSAGPVLTADGGGMARADERDGNSSAARKASLTGEDGV
ncbi:MAKKKK cascade protein kinase regulator Ste50 [Rhodotorula toruloides]|uniref:MAKKKK cascade protein kinase regulator Ste50 n=1 Tax=Rhodotorula toruloides TaxID=5286 RepID=A0A511KDZ6_RHOTO|nr:MAKKKK cascade protein kinase regulator Ste50 [Rhodotorula toruloides]